MKVLFVCTGNTCRSPMAEGYLNSLKLEDVSAKSAGLSVPFPDCANPDAVEVAQDNGIDIKNHISRNITREMCFDADIIFCMTKSHALSLLNSGIDENKIMYPDTDISDPFMRGKMVYESCFCEIKAAVKDMLFKVGYYEIFDFCENDADSIISLETECFSLPWSKNSILSSYNNGTCFVVSKIGEKIVGYGGVSIVSDEAYITNIAVSKPFRSVGIGKKITQKLVDKAWDKGCRFISLEVRSSNLNAISLYADLGFKEAGIRPNFYSAPTEDAVIMTKTVKEN